MLGIPQGIRVCTMGYEDFFDAVATGAFFRRFAAQIGFHP
jgi:hypothetical protein